MISGCLKLWDTNFLNSVQNVKNNELSTLWSFLSLLCNLTFYYLFYNLGVKQESIFTKTFLFVSVYDCKKKTEYRPSGCSFKLNLCSFSFCLDYVAHSRGQIRVTRCVIQKGIRCYFDNWVHENSCQCAVMQGGSMSWCHSLDVHLKQPDSNCQLHTSNWIRRACLNNWL